MPEENVRNPPQKPEDGKPSRVPTSVHMCAIIQSDYADQMSVLDWILHDKQYRAFCVLHNRDIHETDGQRKSGLTGETIEYKAGDKKYPHYHLYVKLPRKLSAATFSKRFGNYVHFQICADPGENARYYLHETFDSRHKAHYDVSEIIGDTVLFADYTKFAFAEDSLDICRRFLETVADNDGDERAAVRALIMGGDSAAVKSVMAHPYFYSRFLSSK